MLITLTWDRFVDFVTVIWLTLFFIDLANPNIVPSVLSWALLTVFIADLGVKYRRVHNVKTFVRKHWADILMVIPYFRVFRILRLFRLLRILRVARIARAGRFPGLTRLETFRRKSNRLVRQLHTKR